MGRDQAFERNRKKEPPKSVKCWFVPKSRKRPRTKKRHRKNRNPLAVDRMFDGVVNEAFKVGTPKVLYHYTTWSGADGILRSQRFWATAHDCTNDEAELKSADAIVMEVARELRRNTRGPASTVLDLFLDGYPKLQITHLRTVYLTCFSVARDDSEQWRKYADDGRGLCLGIRVLDEQPAEETDRATKILAVDYSESSWRSWLSEEFHKGCDIMQRPGVLPTRKNFELGLNALYRIAAFAAIMAKQEKWAVEQEYRRVTIIYREADVQANARISGGKVVRYLTSVARASGKRIALAEIVVGPNQNFEGARQRLIRLLADVGYEVGDMEYPEVVASAVTPWSSGTPAPSVLEAANT